MSTIPASLLVAVNPDVLLSGGETLDVIGLILTQAGVIPMGTVQSFPNADSVADYFGAGSTEKSLADTYFAGFKGASRLPGALLFAQYNEDPVGAFIRGGNVSALTLAQLKAISGSLNIVVDGIARNAGSINLAAATSFSSAAAIIETGLNNASPTLQAITAQIGAAVTGSISGTTFTAASALTGLINVGDKVTGGTVDPDTFIVSQLSGSAGGLGDYEVSVSQTEGSGALVIQSTVLNVSAVASSTIEPGQAVDSSGTTAVITEALSGTGGVGLYQMDGDPQRVTSESMNLVGAAVDVTYSSTFGAFTITSGAGSSGEASTIAFATGTISDDLKLTDADGAVLSQGAAAAVPATFMDALIAEEDNWATFMTAFDPDASGFDNKLAFADWTSGKNDRYAYVCFDTDPGPTITSPDSGCLGAAIEAAEYSGIALQWAEDAASGMELCAFVCGAAASINFTEKNGRITFAYKAQEGMLGDVTSAAVAVNLGGNPQIGGRGNGYNYYGAFGAANRDFIWFQRGLVSGDFQWLDSYINQIWLNNSFQIALLNFLGNARSVSYDNAGYTLIANALSDAIEAGLNFRAFGPGDISQSQQAQVNSDAGRDIAQTLQTQGYYLQILPASSAVRNQRLSPPAKFYYLDRGSVQAITLASIAVT